MEKEFKGDYRILRVVSSSDNPIETLHKFNIGYYSIKTLLDVLEYLDVKETVREDSEYQEKLKSKNSK